MGCLSFKRKLKTDKNDKMKPNKFDDAMEDIMDIKSVQFRGDMLISETQGKPKDHYTEYAELSAGSLYSIKKVVNKLSGCVRSMKEIKKAFIDLQEDEKNFMKEIAILRTLDHPCILKIYEFYQQEKYFYLITEFCENGDLFDKISSVDGPFHEFTAAGIIYQLLSAIYYCNTMSIIHRDIKAESILIESIEKYNFKGKMMDKINIRLADFSSARSYSESKNLTKKVGTVS
jgi:calcium-dependent protein kinase